MVRISSSGRDFGYILFNGVLYGLTVVIIGVIGILFPNQTDSGNIAAIAQNSVPEGEMACKPESPVAKSYELRCQPGASFAPVGAPGFLVNYNPTITKEANRTVYSWVVSSGVKVDGGALINASYAPVLQQPLTQPSGSEPVAYSALVVAVPKGSTLSLVSLIIHLPGS